ncbi:MAG TPA: kynureninase [Acidimicrobiia bacterium]
MPQSLLGPFPDSPGYEKAKKLDAEDPLAHFKQRFVIRDPELIYLDGNSLGRQPLEARATLLDVLDTQWGDRLIRSWNEGWWELQLELGDRLAPIIGALPGEVVISDATSVNLYKLAESSVRARPDRSRIITDDLNFPTDVYVLDGIARAHNLELVIVESDGINGPIEDLFAAIDQDTALVSLSHTVFKSGFTYEMKEINQIAHAAGALTLWDTSHSVGVVPIDLEGSGSDLAVGCTYKYLNSGPGSPAFLYVRKALQAQLENPIAAWWAHANPFDFDLEFEPVAGIRKFHTGTMPILSLAGVGAGIAEAAGAGITAIREKSILLTELLIELWETELVDLGFGLASPREPENRGSHVSLTHSEGYQITRALIEIGKVIPDFRAPDNIRFGLSPLYTSFTNVHTASVRMQQIVESQLYRELEFSRHTIT